MMHFFRTSKIHLDCFTSRADVVEYAPIVNAIETIPDWWKSLPKNAGENFYPTPTMKTCIGMHDYYNKSVAIPLWSDIAINVDADTHYAWQFSDRVTKAVQHPKAQYMGFSAVDNYGHLKVDSPWMFQTKENINWLLTDPIYNRCDFNDYILAQGLLNFSKQHSTNLQLFVDISSPRAYIIPFGTTFLLTPLSDKKVVIHRHLVNEEEYKTKHNVSNGITFINKYRKQQTITKCPFHNHVESK